MRKSLSVLVLLLLVSVFSAISVFAQSPSAPAAAPVAVPVSPFVKAKSVIGKGVFSVMDDQGKPSPFFDVTITVDGPGRYRIDAIPLTPKMVSKGPSFYFNDGKQQYEYNSLNNEYQIADAPEPGQRPMSQLTAMASLNLILSPNKPLGTRITRTVTEELLDGKKMVVFSDREPVRTTKEGVKSTLLKKSWIDPLTGLPVRSSDCIEQDGKIQTMLQIDFQDWKLDTSIPAEKFVWTKPDSAVEAGNNTLAVGTPAPDFEAVTPDGKRVRLSDYKGQVVILDFWATWCGPCQRSLPHLQKVYQSVKDQGVTVLALCVWDDRAKYDSWIKANKATYTFQTAFDPAGRGPKDIAKSLYQVTGIPTQYVIGKDGKIAAGFIGFEEGSNRLEKALEQMKVTVRERSTTNGKK